MRATAGAFRESVIVRSPAIPNSSVSLPVTLQVLRRVNFEVSADQIEIRIRRGQPLSPATVDITADFGGENFNFAATSDQSWLYVWVNQVDRARYQLLVNVDYLQPGTYNANVTIRLSGIQNPQRVVQVRDVVDPAPTIQLSTSVIRLHVIKNQPVQPAVVAVTGSIPNVRFSVVSGSSLAWLRVTQTSQTTPGEIRVSADSAKAEIGYYLLDLGVVGEADQRIQARIEVDVASGAPLDVTPTEVRHRSDRPYDILSY
jgi:hypothetical protein